MKLTAESMAPNQGISAFFRGRIILLCMRGLLVIGAGKSLTRIASCCGAGIPRTREGQGPGEAGRDRDSHDQPGGVLLGDAAAAAAESWSTSAAAGGCPHQGQEGRVGK